LVRFIIQWNLTLGVQNSYPIYRTTQISFKRYTYLQILRQGISPETELATQSLKHLQAQEQNLMSAKLPGGEDGGAIAQR
jgi:hypothetical protein